MTVASQESLSSTLEGGIGLGMQLDFAAILVMLALSAPDSLPPARSLDCGLIVARESQTDYSILQERQTNYTDI